MITEQVIQEVTRRLVERFRPVAIIVFGSQARGDGDSRSDLDLLVLYEFKPGENRSSVWLAMERSLWGLRVGRDIVVMSPREFDHLRQSQGSVARYASEDGRVVHGRAA